VPGAIGLSFELAILRGLATTAAATCRLTSSDRGHGNISVRRGSYKHSNHELFIPIVHTFDSHKDP
jgi:hypothetical protein